MRTGDLVEVEWDDHSFDFGDSSGPPIIRTRNVGYFVREDDEVFILAFSRHDGKFSEVQTIDKRMLVRARRVRGDR